MSVNEFRLDPRSGDVTVERSNGQVDTFSLANAATVDSSGRVLTPDGQVVGGGDPWLLPYVRASASAVLADAYKITRRSIDEAAAALTSATPSSLPTGTQYYIDPLHPNASDSNNGTSPSTPWASVRKFVGLNPGAGSIINLAADATFDDPMTWAQYRARSVFTFNGADNWRGASGNPITVRPYYPRASAPAQMPVVRMYAETAPGDWTQETTILGGRVWSLEITGTAVNGHECFVLFGQDDRVGLNPKAALGAGYGHNPLNMYDADQFSLDLTGATKLFVYVPDGRNPIDYYGRVRVGGCALLNSSWNGLRFVRVTGVKFQYCTLMNTTSAANTSDGAAVGIQIDNCWFDKCQALSYANRTTNATALEGELRVHDNLFTDTPCVGVRIQPCVGTAGNTVQWRVFRNRVYRALLSTSDKGWFYNQSRGGTFFRAWANYGFDVRNGTGGNAIDGSLLYSDLSSENAEFVGNVAEFCGVAYQSNNAINVTIAANVAIDCVRLAMITASTDGTVTNMSARCNHNTWLYTGRRPVPQRGPNVSINSPIVAWNDQAAASGSSRNWTRLEIINNALVDMSGVFAGAIACRYTGAHANTLVVGGFAVAGFSAVKVGDFGTALNQPVTDRTATPWVVRVSGTEAAGAVWFEDAANGIIAPAFDSPLRGSGVPISPAWQDYSGRAFSTSAPDIGAVSFA